MYPLVFEPIYKEMIWGGIRLSEKMNRNLPSNTIGESWDISCRPGEMGIVKNGDLKGKSFIDVLNMDREGYLGSQIFEQESFPLLIKIIDAKQNLSVQVHPGDEYAQKVENYVYGKTEMWYVIDAPEDAYLIIGLKDDVIKESFRKALEDGTVEDQLGRLPIKKGDIINIPAGLVHAITAGVMIAEIQQNSDITYRVYDYGRLGADGKPRQLHVEKAIDVSDFEGKIKRETLSGLSIEADDNIITYYIANKYFSVLKYDIKENIKEQTDGRKFLVFTCVEGKCEIRTEDAVTEIKYGDSVFIPAGMGVFEIVGKCSLLKSFVPEINRDFVAPLTQYGYSTEQIKEKAYVEGI